MKPFELHKRESETFLKIVFEKKIAFDILTSLMTETDALVRNVSTRFAMYRQDHRCGATQREVFGLALTLPAHHFRSIALKPSCT